MGIHRRENTRGFKHKICLCRKIDECLSISGELMGYPHNNKWLNGRGASSVPLLLLASRSNLLEYWEL